MSELRTATRGRRYQFFDTPETDQLMSMLLATLSELSVTRERLFAIERLAEQKGLFTSEEIEAVTFTVADQEKLEAAQNKMLEEVFYPLQFGYRKAQPRKASSKANGSVKLREQSKECADLDAANDEVARIAG